MLNYLWCLVCFWLTIFFKWTFLFVLREISEWSGTATGELYLYMFVEMLRPVKSLRVFLTCGWLGPSPEVECLLALIRGRAVTL